MNLLTLIETVIGTTYYTTVIAPDGFPIVVYSVPYIMACILLTIGFSGVITWLTILVKKSFDIGGID
jgi:hypothetical protein